MKDSHQHKIQHDVDERRYNQIDQWVAAVPHGLQDADKYVVHDEGQGACKIRTEIDGRFRKYIGRSSHPDQNHRRQYYTDHGQRRPCGKAEGNGSVNGLLNVIVPSGAVIPGDNHTGSDRDAIKETYQKED